MITKIRHIPYVYALPFNLYTHYTHVQTTWFLCSRTHVLHGAAMEDTCLRSNWV